MWNWGRAQRLLLQPTKEDGRGGERALPQRPSSRLSARAWANWHSNSFLRGATGGRTRMYHCDQKKKKARLLRARAVGPRRLAGPARRGSACVLPDCLVQKPASPRFFPTVRLAHAWLSLSLKSSAETPFLSLALFFRSFPPPPLGLTLYLKWPQRMAQLRPMAMRKPFRGQGRKSFIHPHLLSRSLLTGQDLETSPKPPVESSDRPIHVPKGAACPTPQN